MNRSCSVEDDGVGQPNADSGMEGLGTQIIRAMTSKLGAKLTYDKSHRGTRVSLECKPPVTAALRQQ